MKYFLLVLLFCTPWLSFAQSDDSRSSGAQEEDSFNEIEGLFEDEGQKEVRKSEERANRAKKKVKNPKSVGELKILETFSDIAVIQKRFLPKTGRFEAYFAGGTNLNDAFFVGNGLQVRLGYYLSERWGLEGVYTLFNNSDREVTQELKKRGVETLGQISTDSFYGIDLKWTPIYGKYAYFSEKIIPFDLYLSLGIGITSPKIGKADSGKILRDPGEPLTFRFGTGQIFALTKWMAFRWDLSWHFFSAQSPIAETEEESFQNNLFLHLGLSFFFPEAKYR